MSERRLRQLEQRMALGDRRAEELWEQELIRMLGGLNEAERFFYERAGYSWQSGSGPRGRIRGKVEGARRLAVAEQAAKERDWRVVWEIDEDAQLHEPGWCNGNPCWQATLVGPSEYPGDPVFGLLLLAHLGGIDLGDNHPDSDPYARVIEAELALDAALDEL
jgi:hypothetical protein